MNLKHLEMMRVMMERVAAKSWEPIKSLEPKELSGEARLIENASVKIKAFDLSYWVLGRGVEKTEQGNVCGFSACAVGHACFDEEFRKLGWSWSAFSEPRFNGTGGWHAVRKFFEIKNGTDDLLFQDNAYPTRVVSPKQVADRIEELMGMGETKFREKYEKYLNGDNR